jgi:hypothetical protein
MIRVPHVTLNSLDGPAHGAVKIATSAKERRRLNE